MHNRHGSFANDALLSALFQATERLIVLARENEMRVRDAVQYIKKESVYSPSYISIIVTGTQSRERERETETGRSERKQWNKTIEKSRI